MNQFLQSCVKARPFQTNEFYHVPTGDQPAWVGRYLPDDYLVITFQSEFLTLLKFSAGGPGLRYGYNVGATARDLPGIPPPGVSRIVRTNIMVFVSY